MHIIITTFLKKESNIQRDHDILSCPLQNVSSSEIPKEANPIHSLAHFIAQIADEYYSLSSLFLARFLTFLF